MSLPAHDSAFRVSRRGLYACVAVLALVYAFLVVMAAWEPITGDAWFVLSNGKGHGTDVASLIKRLRHYHNHANPRLGQFFTLAAYASEAFHVTITPLVILALFVLIFAHAAGRWPRASWGDAALGLATVGLVWIATPAVGQAFFYRPITTNYIYSFVLVLAYFVPLRFGVRTSRWGSALALALAYGLTGVGIGKLNEHTGPVVVLVCALAALVALRERRVRDVLWWGSATLGTLVGFAFLFFAPGLRHRAGAVGNQTVVETVLRRGFEGNLGIFVSFLRYVWPLLAAVALVLFVVFCFSPANRPDRDTLRGRLRVALGYVLLAGAILGISLAAPRSHYRLAIAPALLLVIAGVGLLELVGRTPRMLAAFFAFGLAAHLGFAWMILPLHQRLHREDVKRFALARATRPNQILFLPSNGHPRMTPLYYGDSLPGRSIYRRAMANIFDIAEVRIGRPHRITLASVPERPHKKTWREIYQVLKQRRAAKRAREAGAAGK